MSSERTTRPRKKPKQRRSHQTVNAIVEATARILEEEGFEKASTNRVAKRAGVSIGSLYQYFPNKESLVLAVFERHCGQMLQLLQQHLEDLSEAPIEEAVRVYVRAMLESHLVNPRLHRVLTIQASTLGWNLVKEVHGTARSLLRGYLEIHKERIMPTDLDLAAFVLLMAVEGVTHSAILEYRDVLDFDKLEHEICAFILGYLLGCRPEYKSSSNPLS